LSALIKTTEFLSPAHEVIVTTLRQGSSAIVTRALAALAEGCADLVI
jgi:hypothetical protein